MRVIVLRRRCGMAVALIAVRVRALIDCVVMLGIGDVVGMRAGFTQGQRMIELAAHDAHGGKPISLNRSAPIEEGQIETRPAAAKVVTDDREERRVGCRVERLTGANHPIGRRPSAPVHDDRANRHLVAEHPRIDLIEVIVELRAKSLRCRRPRVLSSRSCGSWCQSSERRPPALAGCTNAALNDVITPPVTVLNDLLARTNPSA